METASTGYLINLDAEPLPLKTVGKHRVSEHTKGGQILFNPLDVKFYLSERQKTNTEWGYKIKSELKDKNALNANVLEYLLQHPEVIPEEWKTTAEGKRRYIYFWGTTYASPGGSITYTGDMVRSLSYYGKDNEWVSGLKSIKSLFHPDDEAAFLEN